MRLKNMVANVSMKVPQCRSKLMKGQSVFIQTNGTIKYRNLKRRILVLYFIDYVIHSLKERNGHITKSKLTCLETDIKDRLP